MGKVTLQSIADQVGVSRMTVSNAFSRPDQLSAKLNDLTVSGVLRLQLGPLVPAAPFVKAVSISLLKKRKAKAPLPEVVIIHLGNNGPFQAEHFDRMEYDRKWTARFGY